MPLSTWLAGADGYRTDVGVFKVKLHTRRPTAREDHQNGTKQAYRADGTTTRRKSEQASGASYSLELTALLCHGQRHCYGQHRRDHHPSRPPSHVNAIWNFPVGFDHPYLHHPHPL
eukprot:752498-Hanusia_phi.AAC.1